MSITACETASNKVTGKALTSLTEAEIEVLAEIVDLIYATESEFATDYFGTASGEDGYDFESIEEYIALKNAYCIRHYPSSDTALCHRIDAFKDYDEVPPIIVHTSDLYPERDDNSVYFKMQDNLGSIGPKILVNGIRFDGACMVVDTETVVPQIVLSELCNQIYVARIERDQLPDVINEIKINITDAD